MRGSKGVVLFIHRQWEYNIIDYEYLDERLILARLKTDRGKATIIAAYAPEEGKTDESVAFYDTLQKVLD